MENEILLNVWEELSSKNLTSSEFDSWKKNITENEEVQNNVHKYLVDNQYTTSNIDEWKANAIPAIETVKINDSASADPAVESNAMGSKLEDGSSELAEPEPISNWQSIKNSFSNLGEQVGDIYEYWFTDDGARSALDIATNSVYSAISGQDTIDEFVKEQGKDSWAAKGLGSEATLEAIKKYETEQSQTKRTKGIIESLSDGDAGGVLAGTVNAFTSMAGSVAYGFLTAGTGFFSDYVAGNYVEFNKLKAKNLGITLDELITSGKADNAIPIGMGAISTGLEMLGIGIVSKGIKGANAAGAGSTGVIGSASKYLAEKLIYNKGARAAMKIIGTGAGEFTTEILQHASDQVNLELGRVAGTEDEAQIGKTFIDAVTSEEGLEAGIQGFIGGGGMTAGSYSAKAMNTIRDAVDSDDVYKSLEELSVLESNLKSAKDNSVRKGIKSLIATAKADISDAVRKGNKIYNSLEDKDISKIENLKDLMDASAFQVTELGKKLLKGDISQKQYELSKSGFEAEYKAARQSLIDMELEKNLEFAKKEAESKGLKFKVYETTKAIQGAVNKLTNISKEDRQEFKDNKGNIHGFAIGNQILINKEVAAKEGAINVGSHEVLHPVFNKLIGNAAEQGKIVKQFRKSMTFTQRSFVDKQMKNRGYTSPTLYNTEYINVFADALRKKQINYDKTAFEKIGDAIVSIFKPKGYENVSFDNGQDVYNFIKEYDISAEQGQLTEKAAAALDNVDLSDAGLKEGISFSKTLTPEQNTNLAADVLNIKELAAENEALAKKYGKEPIKSGKQTRLEQKVLGEVMPVIEKIITNRTKALYDPIAADAKRNVTRQEFQDSMRSDIQTMLFNEYNGTQELEKFLVNRSYLRANDLAKRLGIEEKIKTSLDAVDGEGKEVTQIASDYDYNTTLTEVRSEENRKKKLVDPRKVFGPARSKEYTEAVKDAISEMTTDDFDLLSFANIKDLAPAVTAEFWKTTVKKVVTASANLATGEIPNIQRLILKNADTFIALLPEGSILEGETASENLIGTGVGVPRKLQQVFYDKGERTSKGAGLIPFTLKKGITKGDFLTAFGISEDGTFAKFGGKDPRAQTMLALIRLYGQITSNTAIRELADLTGEQNADIRAGAAAIQFSKTQALNSQIEMIQFSKDLRTSFKLSENQINFKDLRQIEESRNGLILLLERLKEEGYTPGDIANIMIGTARGSWGDLGGGKYIIGRDNKLVVRKRLKSGKYRYQKFLMTGAADFFKLLKNVYPNTKYTKGSPNFKVGKTIYDLDKVPSQSPKGFTDRSMFNGKNSANATISQRNEYSAKQRKNLEVLIKTLSYLYDNKKLTANQTAMVLATLGSSTNGLIRTAAKLVGYSEQGLTQKQKSNYKNFRFEHAQPASATIVELSKLITDKKYPHSFEKIMNGFNVYIIPVIYDNIISNTYKSTTPLDVDDNMLFSSELEQARYKSEEIKKSIEKAGLAPLQLLPFSMQPSKTLSEDNTSVYYNGSPKSISDLGKRTGKVFLATNKKEAEAYAKSNRGEVREVRLKDKEVSSETELLEAIEKAGGDISEGLAYELIDDRFEDFYIGDSKLNKAIDTLKKSGYKAAKYTDGSQVSSRETQSVVVFDKSAMQFSKTLNEDFNNIIEDATGIESFKKFSEAKGKVRGQNKGRFKFFIPPSADDFAGLLYNLTGKSKKGEAAQAWFKENLFDPFSRGINEFEQYKQRTTTIMRAIKKEIKNVPQGLKKVNETGFKNEDAVRVYLWAKNDIDIPGLSETDKKELVNIISNNDKLKEFSSQIADLVGGYPDPQNDWLAGTITTDIINMINTSKRQEFLTEWQANADEIFSKENINKLRAAFGDNYIDALQDMLYRMKSGRARPSGSNKLTNNFLTWVNDSVGTIMFFNTRSAVLQTLSMTNFLNWSDNNPVMAAKAFANQKQFWSDFAMLFNSDFLKQRRSGLKNDVNADDIANAAASSTNKVRAAAATLLKAGFLPTQMADSFAIAMGGASFVRNRINKYVKEGMSKAEAEQQAFLDFQEVTEESQQSSRPDRVSQQQASPLGRIVLAFANTPMQYMRLTKKAVLDIKNGRGDLKTNISKIVYYTAVQNIIFSSLQAAMFAALFEDDDEEAIDKKELKIANSMLDTMLRGVGVYGAIVATGKNIFLEAKSQAEKDRPDFTNAAMKALDISPPISSKMRKLMSGARAFSYKSVREKMTGYGLDNPAYLAVGEFASAATNIPLDRMVKKADNLRVAMDNETKLWQSIALGLGYSQWDLGLVKPAKSKTKGRKKKKRKYGSSIKWGR